MDFQIGVQFDNFNNIVKAQRNFKKSPKERITKPYIQVRLESLERYWSEFTKTHKELLEKFGSELHNHEYMQDDMFEKADEIYIEYKTDLKTILENFSSNEDNSDYNRKQKFYSPSKSTQIELPKIIIPTFSGKYTEWITFRDMFISLVHNNIQLDNVQKMHYLKSYLSGEAEQLLRQIPISEANYERCWMQLKSRYDNKRYLSHYIIKRLLSQKNILTESAQNLKELLDTTNDCLCCLTNIGINISNWDILIIHILTLKLDIKTREHWEFSISNNNSDDLPTLEQFKDFVNKRYRALEFLDYNIFGNRITINNNVNQHATKYKSMHVIKNICLDCSEEHKINSCHKFENEALDKRRDFIMSKKACFNCLSTSHDSKTCQSKSRCQVCQKRHHTLLHQTDPHNDISILHCSVNEKISYNKSSCISTEVEAEKIHNSVIEEALAIPPDKSYINCKINWRHKSPLNMYINKFYKNKRYRNSKFYDIHI